MTRSLLCIALGLACATPALADDTAFTLDALTCFDVQSQSEEDSLFLTGMLIGHLKGAEEMTAAAIVAAIESMDAKCGENPDMMAIEALS